MNPLYDLALDGYGPPLEPPDGYYFLTMNSRPHRKRRNRRKTKMTNELTVRVEHPVIPTMSWNEEEVQKNLDELLAAYTGRVYTPESIKDAKADRAAVNKWDKQLGDALRAAKKLYTDPLGSLWPAHQGHAGPVQAGVRGH